MHTSYLKIWYSPQFQERSINTLKLFQGWKNRNIFCQYVNQKVARTITLIINSRSTAILIAFNISPQFFLGNLYLLMVQITTINKSQTSLKCICPHANDYNNCVKLTGMFLINAITRPRKVSWSLSCFPPLNMTMARVRFHFPCLVITQLNIALIVIDTEA